jgi:hypothetical protein
MKLKVGVGIEPFVKRILGKDHAQALTQLFALMKGFEAGDEDLARCGRRLACEQGHRVTLPLPAGPITAAISPALTVSESIFNTARWPTTFCKFLISIIGGLDLITLNPNV